MGDIIICEWSKDEFGILRYYPDSGNPYCYIYDEGFLIVKFGEDDNMEILEENITLEEAEEIIVFLS